jgi:hypothetical protein
MSSIYVAIYGYFIIRDSNFPSCPEVYNQQKNNYFGFLSAAIFGLVIARARSTAPIEIARRSKSAINPFQIAEGCPVKSIGDRVPNCFILVI